MPTHALIRVAVVVLTCNIGVAPANALSAWHRWARICGALLLNCSAVVVCNIVLMRTEDTILAKLVPGAVLSRKHLGETRGPVHYGDRSHALMIQASHSIHV